MTFDLEGVRRRAMSGRSGRIRSGYFERSEVTAKSDKRSAQVAGEVKVNKGAATRGLLFGSVDWLLRSEA